MDRDFRNLPCAEELHQLIDDVLGPPHGEGRDDELALALHEEVHQRRQPVGGGRDRVMGSVAIGALDNQDIIHVDLVGVADDRQVRPPDVAAEDHRALFPVLGDVEAHDGGAENVSRVVEGGGDPRGHRKGPVVVVPGEAGEGCFGVDERIERLALGTAVASLRHPLVGEFGVFLLDVRGVAQHVGGEVGGGERGVDLPAEAVFDQDREGAGVVDVGVAQDHGVDRRGIERVVAIGAVGFVSLALHQPAVEEDAVSVGLDQVARAGHRPRRAVKRDLHPWSPQGDCRSRRGVPCPELSPVPALPRRTA